MNDPKRSASLLREIAEDVEAGVALTDVWEVRFRGNEKWRPLRCDKGLLDWVRDYPDRVRRKPTFIEVNGVKVPKPLREMEDGQEYWLADVKEGCSPSSFYLEVPHQRRWLRNGLCHATKEARDIHVKAMLLPSRETDDE